MTNRAEYTLDPASTAQFSRLWSTHLDALDRHLSSDVWALVVVAIAMTTYLTARMLIPGVFHGTMPDVVRTVLTLI